MLFFMLSLLLMLCEQVFVWTPSSYTPEKLKKSSSSSELIVELNKHTQRNNY